MDALETVHVGQYIKLHRNRRKLTLNDVHDQTGISLAALSKYEVGKEMPSDEHLARLADLFAMRVDELVTAPVSESVAEPSFEPVADAIKHRRRNSRNSWAADDARLLETVRQVLRSGGTYDDAFTKFAQASGRTKGSISVHYYTSLRRHHGQEMKMAKRAGRSDHESRLNVPSVTFSDSDVDPVAFVVWTMSRLTEPERKSIQKWISEQYPILSQDDLTFAKKSSVTISLDLTSP